MKRKRNISLAVFALIFSFTLNYSSSAIELSAYHIISPTSRFDTLANPVNDLVIGVVTDSISNVLIDSTGVVDLPADSIDLSLPVMADEMEEQSEIKEMISNRSIIELLRPEADTIRYFAWKFNPIYLANDTISIDTLFKFRHLVYPQDKNFETVTYTGNLGGAVQFDHFFSRESRYNFLFSRHFDLYEPQASEMVHYNVRSPLTRLFYSTGGPTSRVEQVVHALQTQNLGKHLNFGISYDFYGTKGRYEHQDTRNNILSLFANYYKGNLSAQLALSNKVYKQEENGGVVDPYLVRDTVVEYLPFRLSSASGTLRNFSVSSNVGYTISNVKQKIKQSDGTYVTHYFPLISTSMLVDYARYSKLYVDSRPNPEYYEEFYISPLVTRDSVAKQTLEGKLMVEISQFKKIPGMPGIRGWVGYDWFDYHQFNPDFYLYPYEKSQEYSAHIGAAAYSYNPYFGYRAAARMFFSGYRADDKVLDGEAWISPWKDISMPRLKGNIEISETTPELFLTNYFSNHIKWENNFKKEKRFLLKGALEAKKWELELGYNLIHIKDYIFFNRDALPQQADNLTVTSAYLQKNFNFFNGLNIFNRIVWQVNSNKNVLSLPDLMLFSSVYYERVLVKNALSGQLGFNLYYRSKFYSDAYNPTTAQFYNQREEKLGGYPFADLFLNFKWKKALIYLKVEHVNQGFPNNNYFATYLYPYNPTVFKYGVLWTFYD